MAVLLQIDFPFSGPWGEDMAAGMEALATSIAAEPGLQWKIWTENSEAGEAGGIYLWSSREDADRLYTDEWKAFVRGKYGTDPSLTFLECPVVVDNLSHEIIGG